MFVTYRRALAHAKATYQHGIMTVIENNVDNLFIVAVLVMIIDSRVVKLARNVALYLMT